MKKIFITIVCIFIIFSISANEIQNKLDKDGYVEIKGKSEITFKLDPDMIYFILTKPKMSEIVTNDQKQEALIAEKDKYIKYLENRLALLVSDDFSPYEAQITLWKGKWDAEFKLRQDYQGWWNKELKANKRLGFAFNISIGISVASIGAAILMGIITYNNRR